MLYPEDMGATIRKYRIKLGLSQQELGDLLGVTFQAVSNWETGKAFPDMTLITRICEVFDINIDILFGKTPEPPPQPVRRVLPAAEAMVQQKPKTIEVISNTYIVAKRIAIITLIIFPIIIIFANLFGHSLLFGNLFTILGIGCIVLTPLAGAVAFIFMYFALVIEKKKICEIMHKTAIVLLIIGNLLSLFRINTVVHSPIDYIILFTQLFALIIPVFIFQKREKYNKAHKIYWICSLIVLCLYIFFVSVSTVVVGSAFATSQLRNSGGIILNYYFTQILFLVFILLTLRSHEPKSVLHTL